MNQVFHNLVRGLALSEGHVLVAHEIGASNTFLPGGHIEIGEFVESALVREILEEIGYRASVGKFLGCVEQLWEEDGCKNYEINHLFQLHIPDLDYRTNPKSLESHLEFYWLQISELKKHNLQPSPIIRLIENPGISAINAWWSSNSG